MTATNITRWLRVGGIALAVLALAESAIEASREASESGPVPAPVSRDPLAIELECCCAITPASAHDEACERAWAENRRRFIGAPPAGARP